jgi:pimeloyl-ACP methyl ester carboxylesterase
LSSFWDYERHYADLDGVRLHYVVEGRGTPVVLIHGVPESCYAWRHVIPLLAGDYRLIAPDLRGLGDSSRPSGGYDKKTMAADVWALVHGELGVDRFAVVGHDFGAPVAFRVAADHPEAVTHLVLLDTGVPGDRPPGSAGGIAPKWWHLFHQVPDLPEALIAGRERMYLEFTVTAICDNPVFSDADFSEYVRTYSLPGAMRAMCELYRALPQDVADNRALLDAGVLLPMPTLGLGGGGPSGRCEDVVESLRQVAKQAEGGAIPGSGHWIPEEKPQELADRLRSFFAAEAEAVDNV